MQFICENCVQEPNILRDSFISIFAKRKKQDLKKMKITDMNFLFFPHYYRTQKRKTIRNTKKICQNKAS